MNKKGFTLVEILGVIILISLISVLILPKIVDSVKNSYDKIDDSTKNMIYKATSLYMNDNESKFYKDENNTYCITLRELVNNNYLKSPINVSDNDITDLKSVQITYNKSFKYRIVNTNSCTEVVNNYVCKPVTTSSLGNVPNGKYKAGDEYICYVGDGEKKTFYVLETSGDSVSLIMDRNIDSNGKGTTNGGTVAWASKEDYIAAGGTEAQYNSNGNEKGPLTALKYLKSSTKSWTKIMSSQISLPTSSQMSTLANNYGVVSYKWLFNNLSSIGGYWLSTAQSSNKFASCLQYDSDDYATLAGAPVEVTDARGVRPVITLSKDQIKEPERTCSIVSGTGTNMGDIVECNDDNFYVIENASGRVKLLAVNNISTTSNISDAIDEATNYGNILINNRYNIISSRLLYLYEVYNALSAVTVQINSHESELKPITTSNGWNKIDLTWLYQNSSKNIISYWMLYSEDDNGYSYDNICVNGTKAAIINSCNGTLGVRPVITIPSSILR